MEKVVKLSPAVKSYIWGGNYFQKFGKGNGEDIISELWELSVRGENSSLLSNGKRLDEVITKADIGPNSDRFP